MRSETKNIKPRFFKMIVAVLIVAAVAIFCAVVFRKNIVPTVIDSSIAQVRAITTNAINLAATTVLNDNITYDDLFNVQFDNDGKVSMIQANSPRINAIAREIANMAQANLDSLGVQEISIAAGTFTGLALLTGFGPYVTINIVPIGTANCDFVSYFLSAGINQTLHKIYIDVYADVNIITPLDEPSVKVKAEILVCENVIVGEIPDTVLDLISPGGGMNLKP